MALSLPNSDVRLLIEEDEQELSAGGIFLVESVDTFYQENMERMQFVKEPIDIPPGRYAIIKDPSGNYLRIMDFTNEN